MNMPHCQGVPDTDQTLALAQSAGDHQHQGDCKIRGGIAEHAGRVGDDHATPGAGGDIDVVVTDGHVGDDLQLRRSGEECLVDSIGQQRDRRIGRGELFVAHVRGDRLVVIPRPQVADRAEQFETGVGDPSGDDDSRRHDADTQAASLPSPSVMSSTEMPE